jgi:hypothetical protein
VVVLCVCAWVVLAVMAFSVFVMNFEGRTHAGYEPWLYVFALGAVAVLVLEVLAVVVRARWRWLVTGAALVAVGFGFLAHDAASPAKADLGVRVSADDPGIHTLMWLSEKSSHSRLKEPGAPTGDNRELYLPSDSEKWAEHVDKNRAAIIAAWEADKIGREWVAALNTRPPAGVWSPGLGAPLLDFKAVRAVLSVRLARSYVLALDGRRDEALGCVAEFASAMYAIERTSAALIHPMIATVALKQCYAVAGEILNLGPASDAGRADVAAILKNALPVQRVVRQAILGEGDFVGEAFDTIKFPRGSALTEMTGGRWVDLGMRFGGKWILCNPNRSVQRVREKLDRVSALAEARDIAGLKAEMGKWNHGSPFKNPVGRLLAFMILPAVTKPVENIWLAEDQRLALIARLEGRGTESAK